MSIYSSINYKDKINSIFITLINELCDSNNVFNRVNLEMGVFTDKF